MKVRVDRLKMGKWDCIMCVVSLWLIQEFVDDDNFKIFWGKKNHDYLWGLWHPTYLAEFSTLSTMWAIEENTAAAYLLFSGHLLSLTLLLETGKLARWIFLFWPGIALLLSYFSFVLWCIITYLQWKTSQYLLTSCTDDLSLEIYE